MDKPTNAGLYIPRVTFEFNPDEFNPESGDYQTPFSLVIPGCDVEAAVLLPRPLEANSMPVLLPGSTMASCLNRCSDIRNPGGALTLEKNPNQFTIRFGFAPLSGESSRRSLQTLGRTALLEEVARLTNMQYQFGVPESGYDAWPPSAPARLSFANGRDITEPRIVVTRRL